MKDSGAHSNSQNGNGTRQTGERVASALGDVERSRQRLVSAIAKVPDEASLIGMLRDMLTAHGDGCEACTRAITLLGDSGS